MGELARRGRQRLTDEHPDPGIAERQFDLVRGALTDTSNRCPVRSSSPLGARQPEADAA